MKRLRQIEKRNECETNNERKGNYRMKVQMRRMSDKERKGKRQRMEVSKSNSSWI